MGDEVVAEVPNPLVHCALENHAVPNFIDPSSVGDRNLALPQRLGSGGGAASEWFQPTRLSESSYHSNSGPPPAAPLPHPYPDPALDTPSPDPVRDTPSPDPAHEIPSPYPAREMPSPDPVRDTPSPITARETPSPEPAHDTPSLYLETETLGPGLDRDSHGFYPARDTLGLDPARDSRRNSASSPLTTLKNAESFLGFLDEY